MFSDTSTNLFSTNRSSKDFQTQSLTGHRLSVLKQEIRFRLRLPKGYLEGKEKLYEHFEDAFI